MEKKIITFLIVEASFIGNKMILLSIFTKNFAI